MTEDFVEGRRAGHQDAIDYLYREIARCEIFDPSNVPGYFARKRLLRRQEYLRQEVKRMEQWLGCLREVLAE